MRDLQPGDVDARVAELLAVDRDDAGAIGVPHHDVVLLERHLDLVAVDARRSSAPCACPASVPATVSTVPSASVPRRIVMLRYSGLSASTMSRVSIPRCSASSGALTYETFSLTMFVKMPLSAASSIDADVVGGELAAHLDVEARERRVRQAGEELTELLDEGDAGAHERIDDAAGDVDGIRNQVALEREPDRSRDRDAGLLLRLLGDRTEVRGDDDVRQVEQREAPSPPSGGSRDEDVEPGAGDHAGGEGRVQRILVDQAAAGDVDDVRGRLHERELRGADHARSSRESSACAW